MVAVLDFWLSSEKERSKRAVWLLNILEAVDADPWRLAEAVDVARQPAETLDLLAWFFFRSNHFAEPLKLLERARRQYPHDFWLNHDLAVVLYFSRPPQLAESVRYYTAALAIRRSPAAHVNLGLALYDLKRLDEAATEFQAALELHLNMPRRTPTWARSGMSSSGWRKLPPPTRKLPS